MLFEHFSSVFCSRSFIFLYTSLETRSRVHSLLLSRLRPWSDDLVEKDNEEMFTVDKRKSRNYESTGGDAPTER